MPGKPASLPGNRHGRFIDFLPACLYNILCRKS